MNKEMMIPKLQSIFDVVFLDPVTVTPELSALEVDSWDSLSHISLLISIEKEFKIKFRVGEVEGTKNVGDLMAIIEKRLQEK